MYLKILRNEYELREINFLKVIPSNSEVKINHLGTINLCLNMKGLKFVELLKPEIKLDRESQIEILYQNIPIEIKVERTNYNSRILEENVGTIKCVFQDLIDRINSGIRLLDLKKTP